MEEFSTGMIDRKKAASHLQLKVDAVRKIYFLLFRKT